MKLFCKKLKNSERSLLPEDCLEEFYKSKLLKICPYVFIYSLAINSKWTNIIQIEVTRLILRSPSLNLLEANSTDLLKSKYVCAVDGYSLLRANKAFESQKRLQLR